jgi:hypothetical protein
MAHFFNNFPLVQYDIEKTNRFNTVQNPLLRFKLLDILQNRSALYYEHIVEEGQSAQFIANRYYQDVTLDWVIYLVNDIQDPIYGWPLDYQVFTEFVKSKYGSIESALNTVHHYEWIYQDQQVLFDGTLIPEDTINVDATTYASLGANEKREVSNYTYEERENEKKRQIKILQREYLDQFLAEAESIFE